MTARHRPLVWFAAFVALAGTRTAVSAQTNDQARVTVGVSAGYISSVPLWNVDQPICSVGASCNPSIWHLQRELRSDISISGQVTYFGQPHLGITGEFTYLGLGSTDDCTIVHDNGDPDLQAACDALKGDQRPASVTTIQGGAIYRPITRTLIQPYFKGMAGLAFTPLSTVEMESIYGVVADTAVLQITVYRDPDWKPVRATLSLAAGFATASNGGYQLRAEVRETWMPLSAVAGPVAEGQGFIPAINHSFKHFTSVMVGFDVVLEKNRGRRY
ncbi:MAG TPA: hypothetical protein VGL65_01245 [Gemmatimonadales bacterium]|jgi:hypothetical protein